MDNIATNMIKTITLCMLLPSLICGGRLFLWSLLNLCIALYILNLHPAPKQAPEELNFFQLHNCMVDSQHGISYLCLRLQGMVYQNDISRMSTTVKNAQAGNDLIENCMESKMLDLHPDKSCYIITGKNAFTKK